MQAEDRINQTNAFQWMKKTETYEGKTADRVIETDVLIIGAGHAGTCAARAASEVKGTRVTVLEQQKRDGQVILGVGEVGHINSRWQKEQGVPPVDVDEFVNDWKNRTNNRSNYRLIRKYAANCHDGSGGTEQCSPQEPENCGGKRSSISFRHEGKRTAYGRETCGRGGSPGRGRQSDPHLCEKRRDSCGGRLQPEPADVYRPSH